MDRALTCENIFSIRGEPTQTLIAREKYIKQIINTLREGQIPCVVGMSKSGKTLLVRQTLFLYQISSIWLFGSQMVHPDSVWRLLAQQMHIDEDFQRNPEQTQEKILTRLVSEEILLVIDDFHFIINPEHRLAVLLAIKLVNERSGKSVVIGVKSPQTREIEYFNDLNGRIRAVIIDNWSIQELSKIALKGFNARQSTVGRLERLAYESFGSPFLMQLLCQIFCKRKLEPFLHSEGGIASLVEHSDPATMFEDVFPSATLSVQYGKLYSLLTEPSACEVERKFRRHDNRAGNLNQLILYAATGKYPSGAMPYSDIQTGRLWHRIRECLAEDEMMSSQEETERAVKKMVGHYFEFYRETSTTFSRHDPLVDYGEGKFYIHDPFLLFYIRHSPEVEESFLE